jgi:hypothetical protein
MRSDYDGMNDALRVKEVTLLLFPAVAGGGTLQLL